MKTIIKYIILPGAIFGASALLQSCAMESPFANRGEGSLSINTEINGETLRTRADNNLDNPDYVNTLQEKCVVFIENQRGVMRKYKGVSNIPSSIKLSTGNYVCNAWTGDSVSASFDSKFYRGQQTFEIVENQNTALTVKCNIANVVVSVDGESVARTGLKNPKITFTTSRGELVFDEMMFADKKGYFMIPSPEDKAKDPDKYAENTTIAVKIEGEAEDGTPYTKESEITDVQRAHEYQVSLTADKPTIDEGGALIQLVIKDIPIIEDTVEIFPAPIVKGYGFDMSEQIVNTDNSLTDQKLYICEYKGTGRVQISFSENFTDIPSGDLLDNSYVEQLSGKGVNVERKDSKDSDSGVDVYEIYVTFPSSFLNGLASSDTEYKVTIIATDSRNLVTTAALRIANSMNAVEKIDDAIADEAPDPEASPMAVLLSSAELSGTLYNTDASRYGFKYRKVGESAWNEAVVNPAKNIRRKTRAKGIAYSIKLTGLIPGTTYEYKAFADDFESEIVQNFTTESKYEIPNASFENWSTYKNGSKNIVFPGLGSEPTVWDSGNEGAATAGATLTNKSEDMKHSGKFSARLESKYVIIKFAAGNIFMGDYVRTDGTDGVLSFGRPYNGSHPAKLKVWANYRPSASLKGTESEAIKELSETGCDHSQIYVALSDEPIEIRTKSSNQKLFSIDDPHVLAYGEVTWKGNFGPDGALEAVEIPIEYFERAKTKKATHLIITCCASKFGDYFYGGDGSVLYLDDFELIYE